MHLKETRGGLDILVNNAVLSPWRSIDDTDPDLFGEGDGSEHARQLVSVGRGDQVNETARRRFHRQHLSVAAMHPDRMLALYSTFKTAMIGMSRSFALEYGEFGIRVNTIPPGLIDTKLAKAFEGEEMKKIISGTPAGRIGRPEEIGYAVLYLSSAGAYVTAQISSSTGREHRESLIRHCEEQSDEAIQI